MRVRKTSAFLQADGTNASTGSAGKAGNYDITSSGRIYFVEQGLLRFVDESGLIRTYTGQALNGGHNVNSINVRLRGNVSIHKSNSGFIFADSSERIFEHKFLDSKLYVRAGNCQGTLTDSTMNALSTGIETLSTGGNFMSNIAYDPITDSIFATARIASFSGRYSTVQISSTGVITPLVGGAVQNSNTYPNVSDGFLGINLTTTGGLDSASLKQGVVGFNPNSRKILIGLGAEQLVPWQNRHQMLKYYDLIDQKVYHYSGINSGPGPTYTIGINTNNFSSDRTVISNSSVPRNIAATNGNIYSFMYDPDNPTLNGGPRYIAIAREIGRMVSLPVDNTKTVQSMAANFSSRLMAYTRKSGNAFVYICNFRGQLQRAPLATESASTVLSFTTLPLPSGVTCDAFNAPNSTGQMYYDHTRQSIIFPIRQNYNYGIAEYYDP